MSLTIFTDQREKNITSIDAESHLIKFNIPLGLKGEKPLQIKTEGDFLNFDGGYLPKNSAYLNFKIMHKRHYF